MKARRTVLIRKRRKWYNATWWRTKHEWTAYTFFLDFSPLHRIHDTFDGYAALVSNYSSAYRRFQRLMSFDCKYKNGGACGWSRTSLHTSCKGLCLCWQSVSTFDAAFNFPQCKLKVCFYLSKGWFICLRAFCYCFLSNFRILSTQNRSN